MPQRIGTNNCRYNQFNNNWNGNSINNIHRNYQHISKHSSGKWRKKDNKDNKDNKDVNKLMNGILQNRNHNLELQLKSIAFMQNYYVRTYKKQYRKIIKLMFM